MNLHYDMCMHDKERYQGKTLAEWADACGHMFEVCELWVFAQRGYDLRELVNLGPEESEQMLQKII